MKFHLSYSKKFPTLVMFHLGPELEQACFLHALLCKLIKVSRVTS
jgi:hypothetical protein